MRARRSMAEELEKYMGAGAYGYQRTLCTKPVFLGLAGQRNALRRLHEWGRHMKALNSVHLHRLTCNGRLGCCSQLHAAPGVLRSASRTRENGLRRLQEIKALRRLNDTEARP